MQDPSCVEEEEQKQHQQQQQQQPPPPNASRAASEMLNLPRDFLSLRPQEHSLVPLAAAAAAAAAAAVTTAVVVKQEPPSQLQQEQAEAQLREEQAGSPIKATPLIAVPMAPAATTPPVVLRKCSQQVYPRALASHAEVLADRNLFLDTLRRLHGSIGHKSLTIPTIGGTQLDLHLLYREVTARGGLQKVIKERIWKEIKAVFHFPPTTTNASYVLRKYYSSLLHHYEQVYFFRNEGSLILAPGDTPQSSEILSDDSDAIKMHRKRHHESTDAAATAQATSCVGQMVTGSIEGKFEHGYLVSVTVGSEKLRGVLYNVPPGEYIPQFTTTSKLPNGNQVQSLVAPTTEVELPRKRRRRLGIRKKDPNAPKLNRSAYNFFFAEQRARIRLVQPNKEISRMIGDSWSKLTAEQRLPYQERGLVDKERYRKEIKQYRERIKMQASAKDESPVVGHVHEEEEESEDAEEQENLENNVPDPTSSGLSPNSSSQHQRQIHEQLQQETLKFKSILPTTQS